MNYYNLHFINVDDCNMYDDLLKMFIYLIFGMDTDVYNGMHSRRKVLTSYS